MINRSNIKNNKIKGHPYSKYPEPLTKCHYSNKVGHKPEVCRSWQDTPGSTKTDTTAMAMRISNSSPCEKFVNVINVGNVYGSLS